MADVPPPRLLMTGIGKSFGGVPVLSDVDLAVGRGEIVALLGANGAGKSTLMKVLTGVYRRDAGEIRIDGAPADIASPRDAAQAAISFLPQELSVMPDMTVAENVCLGIMGRVGRGPFTDRRAMRARAADVLAELGFGHIDVDAPLRRLSVAEARVVEIARAVAADARVLVMDEPTAALSEQDSALIFRILRRLRDAGGSVVYISHYLNEVFAISDRIEVLRDGRNAGSFKAAETSVDEVLAAMLGRAAGHLFDAAKEDHAVRPSVLEVDGVSWRDRLRGITFDLREGEILGVFGLIGSGVEHLGRVLFGAEGAVGAGAIRLGGRPYAPSTPARAKAAGIGFVTAERKSEGILGDLSVAQNLAAAFWPEHGRWPLASTSREARLAQGWINTLGIRTAGPAQPIRLLSGGNQQKVCVARWLHSTVRVLILEEPTRGVDMGARRDLYGQLAAFARDGLAILVLSSDAEEVAGLSDRSFVMDRGRIVRRFDGRIDAGGLLAATAGEAGETGEAREAREGMPA